MGLFDKKYCAICGSKIRFLGNKKLEDGDMCGDCQKKLSPWFSERRHSTVAEIKDQLAYREANEAKVASFDATRTLGSVTKILLDEGKRQFLVSRQSSWKNDNPDVLDYAQLTGYDASVRLDKDEQKTKDSEGKSVSYDPPRYRYAYDFRVKLHVSNPYFDEMSFEVFPTVREESTLVNDIPRLIHGENYKNTMAAFDELRQTLDAIAPCLSWSAPEEEAAPEAEAAAPQEVNGMDITRFVFPAMPKNVEEMLSLPCVSLHNPFSVAAMAVTAFCVFPEDPDMCFNMVNALKGPQPLSTMDKSFIRDRFYDGKTYVPRSYLAGAVPGNNYKPDEPFTIQVDESVHSRDQFEQGYITLYITSGGADSPRPVTLRHKPSTDEWFLWNYVGLLADIRKPVSEDPWA